MFLLDFHEDQYASLSILLTMLSAEL